MERVPSVGKGFIGWRAVFLLPPCAPAALDRTLAQVVIDGFLYDPDPTNQGGEFIELFNGHDASVGLSGWALANAVTFTFPAGTILGPGGYLVVARDEAAARTFYGIDNVAGQYEGALSNGGDSIFLADSLEGIVDFVCYGDETPWPGDLASGCEETGKACP
jgi:hypothetical protein